MIDERRFQMFFMRKYTKMLLCYLLLISIFWGNTKLILAEEITISQSISINSNPQFDGLEYKMLILNDGDYNELILKENELLELEITVENTSTETKNVQFFMSMQDINGNVCQIAMDECSIESSATEQLNVSKMVNSDKNIEKADIYLWDNYNSAAPYIIYSIDKTGMDYYGNTIDDAIKISSINNQVEGIINNTNDSDYISFIAPSSGSYTIKCFSMSEEMELKGYLYDSDNSKLSSVSDNNYYKLTVNLNEGDRYYLNTTSANTGEYFIKIYSSENVTEFNILDYDVEINGYKNQIKELCEKAFDNEEYELSEEIYNKFEMAYDTDIVLHELPEYLKNIDIVSSEYEDTVNEYYSIKQSDFKALKQEYLSILSEYSIAEQTVALMSASEADVNNETSNIKEHICGISFKPEETSEGDETENAIQSRASTSLQITGIGNKSISYKAIFPISGEPTNMIYLWNFHNGITEINKNPEGASTISGSHNLSGLLEGGMYLIQMSWYTSSTTTKTRYAWAQLKDTSTEEYYEESSEHITASIETKDVAVDKKNNFSKWLSRMDLVYEALENFTGYTPYNGEKIKIQSTREDMNNDSDIEQGNDYWKLYMGYSGNPVRFSRPFFRGLLGRLHAGDWGDTPIHELSHDFDIDEWCFDYETLADLKLCYIVDTLEDSSGNACKIYRTDTDTYYTKDNINRFFQSHQIECYNNTFSQGDYSSRGMTYVMLKIQDLIGWEPFSETFKYMGDLSADELSYIYSSDNPEEIGKFNLFMTKLRDFSGVDVISKLTAKEKTVIKEQYGGEIEYYVAPPADIKSDGGKANISVPAGSEATRRFIPSESGMYDIFTTRYGGTSGNNDTVIEVYGDDYFQELLAQNDNYNSSLFSKVTLELEENQTYYIKIKHAQESRIFADLKIAKSSQEIELDTPVEKDVADMESALFKFTPTENGTYIFRTNRGNVLTGLTGNVIIGLYEDELLTKRIICSQYEVNIYPQFAADLIAGKTYYILYNGYLNKAVRARVSVAKAAEMSISDMKYNGGKGFMAGDGNTLTFTLNIPGNTTGSYYIVPELGWNQKNFYNKNGATVEISGTSAKITLKNIRIDKITNNILYTRIKVYDSDSVLLWAGPEGGKIAQRYHAYCYNVELSDDFSYTDELDYYKPIECNTRETFIVLDKEIPAGKIIAASFLFNNENGMVDANNYIESVKMCNVEGNWTENEVRIYDRASPCSRIIYFATDKTGKYLLKINFKDVELPSEFNLGVYTLDYIADDQRFSRYDALELNEVAQNEENNGTRHTYLIFNAPEHLLSDNQLGDNYRYISKMPVNGNANIYWEHLNKYAVTKKYGILLFNPTAEEIEVTINKKSAYYESDLVPFTSVPLKIWKDYKNGAIISDSLTGITSTNNTLTIQPKCSEWIYLEDIPSKNVTNGTLFNGIINLSVHEGKELDCYAFIFSDDTARAQIESDFNLYGNYGNSGNYTNYIRADEGYQMISGTTDAPMLVSQDIDLSGREDYRLLLTGYDAPYINAGERAGLYYDGAPIGGTQMLGDNGLNFSVIYKLNIKNFADGKMVLEYNKYTNAGYLEHDWNGIYVAAFDGTEIYSKLLIKDNGYELNVPINSTDAEIYLVVSGMSVMPVTVRFE